MSDGLGTIKVKYTKTGKKYFLGGSYYGIYLTEREFDVLKLIREHKYQEIAEILGLSRRTVEAYVAKVKGKFNCQNKLKLTNLLIQSETIFEIEQFEDV